MSNSDHVAEMPRFGYGTWQRRDQECYDCVQAALDVGYRHIDTAEGYKNEEFVGAAIAESDIPRSEIWITTKVGPESFGPGQVRPAAERSLEKLRTDKVDLLLLHWPSINDEYEIEDYMAQFAEVYDAGLTRNIGVSNFTKSYMDKALSLLGDRKLLTNQCEIHAYMQNRPIVDYCTTLDIPMTAYSPLARGAVKDDPVLGEIGAAHDANASQVALAFLLHEGHYVIPTSSNRDRIAENFDAQRISLSDEELARIRGVDRGMRVVNGAWCPTWDV